MTKQDMLNHLKSLGLSKTFKPIYEQETETILLQVRKPAQIVEGHLQGTEIALSPDGWRIWTPRVKRARALAAQHGLKFRKWDGECEILVPHVLADELLPLFGAKVKRVLPPEQLERARQRARNARAMLPKPVKTGVTGLLPPKTDPSHV